jgi:hypothetical protein
MSIHWGGRGAGHVSRWSLATTGAPALALNFLSGTLDPRITFTRSGNTATRINSSGAIELVNANLPRFDYDPVTLASKGLLIEEQRINLLLNSLIDGTSLSTQSVTVAAVAHTISFYGTGTITLTGASVATVTGTGVYPNRRTLTFTPIVGVLVCTVTGSVQYAQLEAGAFATSFVPTAGSAVTRSPDVAVMTGTNFSSWFNPVQGSFMVQADTASFLDLRRNIQVDDGTNAERIYLGTNTAANPLTVVSDGGAIQANLPAASTTLTVNTPYKIAMTYKINDFAVVGNGGTVAVDSLGTLPTVLQMRLGANENTVYLNGHIRQIAYYNTRLLNAQLQTLTT